MDVFCRRLKKDFIAASSPQGDVGSSPGISPYTIRDEMRTPNTLAPRIGGEVFSLSYRDLYTGLADSPSPASSVKIPYTNAYWSQTPTISRPSNGGPLVQPTAALLPL